MFKILTPARDRQNRVLTETGTRRQMGAESERQGKGKMMRQEAESQPPNENEGVWETARDKDKATEKEGHTETERQEKGVGREIQRDKQTQGEQDRRGGGEGERQRLEEDGQKHENVTESSRQRERGSISRQSQVWDARISPLRTFSRYKAGSQEASEAGGSILAGRLRVLSRRAPRPRPASSLPFPRFPGCASLSLPPHP